MARGLMIDRATLEAWAGRALNDGEVIRLEECLKSSSVPEAIATIVDSF